MSELIKKIQSKYSLQKIFNYVPINRVAKIIKFNKKIIGDLDLSIDYIKKFLFMKKIIKPIANCEDYLTIMQRIFNSNIENNNQNKEEYITKIFYNYLNRNNKFIPQINYFIDNPILLMKLNSFKIGLNSVFIDNFLFENNYINFKKLIGFCNSFGKKLKEITFMGNDISNDKNQNEIILNIIKNSNIQKIEDRCSKFNNKSLFMDLIDNENNETKNKNKNKFKINKNIIDIIKELKYYSLYFDTKNITYIYLIIKALCDNILLIGKNIEELEISMIDKESSLYFVNSLKNLDKLRVLKISCKSDNELLFDEISNVIKENNLIKLEMNLNNFEEGYNIINKNINLLNELLIKINNKINDNIKIIKTLSNIINLKKLKINSDFPIIEEKNIKYLCLKNVKYLEIPLIIEKNLFDLNYFFEKIPKLKKINFYGIKFIDNKNNNFEHNLNIMEKLKLNYNYIENLKKISFYNSKKNSSFFIFKLIQIISNTKSKQNIKKIKIENCDFDKTITINNLIDQIFSFENLNNLKLINISFKNCEFFNFDRSNYINKLEKLYLTNIYFDKNYYQETLKIILSLSKQNKSLTEIGFSNIELKNKDINSFLTELKNLKLLIKINIFNISDNFDINIKKDIIKRKKYSFDLGKISNSRIDNISSLDLGIISNYCLINLRDADIEGNNIFYPKIIIKDYFHETNGNKITNTKEKYYCYQKLSYNFSIIKNYDVFPKVKKQYFKLEKKI